MESESGAGELCSKASCSSVCISFVRGEVGFLRLEHTLSLSLIKQIAGVSWLEREPQQPQELESAEPQPQGTQGIASLGGYVGGHALQRLGMGAR